MRCISRQKGAVCQRAEVVFCLGRTFSTRVLREVLVASRRRLVFARPTSSARSPTMLCSYQRHQKAWPVACYQHHRLSLNPVRHRKENLVGFESEVSALHGERGS